MNLLILSLFSLIIIVSIAGIFEYQYRLDEAKNISPLTCKLYLIGFLALACVSLTGIVLFLLGYSIDITWKGFIAIFGISFSLALLDRKISTLEKTEQTGQTE